MVAAAEASARRIVAEAEAAPRRAFAPRRSRRARREGEARAAAVARSAPRRRATGCLADAEHEIAALAIAVARKVLGRELAARPSAVADLAARALAEVRAAPGGRRCA